MIDFAHFDSLVDILAQRIKVWKRDMVPMMVFSPLCFGRRHSGTAV